MYGFQCESDSDCHAMEKPSICKPAHDGNDYCSFTMCLRPCDENGECPVGEENMGWSDGCYCRLEQTLPSRFGEDCTGAYPHASLWCGTGEECVPLTNGTQCETDADCAAEDRLSICRPTVDGNDYCFYGVCMRSCDENNSCPEDERVEMLGEVCYCGPIPTK